MEKQQKQCEHPEKLKGKPEDCSPEQIKECHGADYQHHCCQTNDKDFNLKDKHDLKVSRNKKPPK